MLSITVQAAFHQIKFTNHRAHSFKKILHNIQRFHPFLNTLSSFLSVLKYKWRKEYYLLHYLNISTWIEFPANLLNRLFFSQMLLFHIYKYIHTYLHRRHEKDIRYRRILNFYWYYKGLLFTHCYPQVVDIQLYKVHQISLLLGYIPIPISPSLV